MKGLRDITNSLRSLKETSDDYVRFTLKRATVEDTGTYCVLAKNRHGCDRAFFTVRLRQRARSLTPVGGGGGGGGGACRLLGDMPTYLERRYAKGKRAPAAGNFWRPAVRKYPGNCTGK